MGKPKHSEDTRGEQKDRPKFIGWAYGDETNPPSIAGMKLPRAVRFIPFDDMPRSTTGKVMRHELEALLKEENA